ncbi:MAG: cobalt-precorrin 5A hydrolase [Desulfobulbaceae bacterium]|nr:cobalt-precorrin 5A hydrolase [Desulfobulbaceae bacterium]HIJ79334.1 cobalt-precorrin 5A hydrolase [Deltaproteobacteria bacterium]
MKLGIIAITSGGRKLAQRIAAVLPNSLVLENQGKIAETFARHWHDLDGFVCVMAAGIAVRAIAPLLESKQTDPCVVVLDESGHHVISLLSGHLGGGNGLATEVAELLGATPVITTASDTLGLPALDLWAREQQLLVEDKEALTAVSARLVNRGSLKIFAEQAVGHMPPALHPVTDPAEADVIVSAKVMNKSSAVFFRPPTLVVGVGCNRGTPASEFEVALAELFEQEGLSPLSIRNLASIDAKDDEEGLLAFAKRHGWRIDFYNKEEINNVGNVAVSPAALKAVGAKGVAEPAALLSAQNKELLVGKRKWQNVTMAVARVSST